MTKKRIYLCTVFALLTSVANAIEYDCTPQEMEIFQKDSVRIKYETDFAAEEMIVRWKKRYIIPQEKFGQLEYFVKNCEFRKVCQNHLYADTLQKRVESKMATDEMYRDSIFTLLIPISANKISGDNICLALQLAKFLRLDASQYDYLMDKALDMAHRIAKNRTLNVWNEEMELLRNTLTEGQQTMFFYKKNAQGAKNDVDLGWSKLDKANLTGQLDSVKDKKEATLYYIERRRIKDIYRYYGTSQKKHLAELSKYMPKMVLMLDALDKKNRMTERKNRNDIGKEFTW